MHHKDVKKNIGKGPSIMDSMSQTKKDASVSFGNIVDPKDFMHAYDTHVNALYRFALFKVNNRELAEDLVSQTFTQTWQYLLRGETISAWKVFLFRTLSNLIVNHYRRKHLEPVLVDERIDTTLISMIDEQHMPVRLNQSLEFRSIINFFNVLPQDQKEILLLRFVDDMSISDIASISGKNKSAVYVSIHRSIKKIKSMLLNNNGINHID